METENQSCCGSGHLMKHVIVIIMVLGIIALGIISLIREKIVNPNMDRVTITAQGRAYAKPDIAQIIVAVKTDRVKESVKAVKDNTDKMNGVVSKLKELGVEAKDIQTTNYRLNPVYDYITASSRSVLAGYEVYQEVTIKVRNLDKVGEIIEAVTAVGANQVGDIAFTIDDTDEIKKVARAEAVTKAQQKAKEMAELTGIKLGKLVNVYENEGYVPMPQYLSNAKSIDLGMGGGAAPEIQTGENEVRLEVTLVYEVR